MRQRDQRARSGLLRRPAPPSSACCRAAPAPVSEFRLRPRRSHGRATRAVRGRYGYVTASTDWCDEDFAGRYPRGGRPGISPGELVGAVKLIAEKRPGGELVRTGFRQRRGRLRAPCGPEGQGPQHRGRPPRGRPRLRAAGPAPHLDRIPALQPRGPACRRQARDDVRRHPARLLLGRRPLARPGALFVSRRRLAPRPQAPSHRRRLTAWRAYGGAPGRTAAARSVRRQLGAYDP